MEDDKQGMSLECDHMSVMPTVTDEQLKGLTAREVHEKYPRFMGECPECKQGVILYSTYLHYLAGDY